MSGWERATKTGAYTTGYKPTATRYRDAIQRVVAMTEVAYLESSVPAPHPVWWKRLLRRPYRRVDRAQYLEALQRIHNERVP